MTAESAIVKYSIGEVTYADSIKITMGIVRPPVHSRSPLSDLICSTPITCVAAIIYRWANENTDVSTIKSFNYIADDNIDRNVAAIQKDPLVMASIMPELYSKLIHGMPKTRFMPYVVVKWNGTDYIFMMSMPVTNKDSYSVSAYYCLPETTIVNGKYYSEVCPLELIENPVVLVDQGNMVDMLDYSKPFGLKREYSRRYIYPVKVSADSNTKWWSVSSRLFAKSSLPYRWFLGSSLEINPITEYDYDNYLSIHYTDSKIMFVHGKRINICRYDKDPETGMSRREILSCEDHTVCTFDNKINSAVYYFNVTGYESLVLTTMSTTLLVGVYQVSVSDDTPIISSLFKPISDVVSRITNGFEAYKYYFWYGGISLVVCVGIILIISWMLPLILAIGKLICIVKS